jgi:hypothetical protein
MLNYVSIYLFHLFFSKKVLPANYKMNHRVNGFAIWWYTSTCNSDAGVLFWFDVIFWVPKTNPNEEVTKYALYTLHQHFTRKKTDPNVIKRLAFLKKTPTQISESVKSFTLGTFSDFVMVENALSFPDLTLRYLIWDLSFKYSKFIW